MKRIAVIGTLAAIAISIWYLRRPTPSTANTEPPATSSLSISSSSSTAPSDLRRIDRVTKLAPQERRRLADRIAAAQSARTRAAIKAPKLPSLPTKTIEKANADDGAPTISADQIRGAMSEVIPHIAECYEAAVPTLASPDITIRAELTLTGDPDIGTIIDANQLVDDAGKPLPAQFDDCMRTTFMSLALPPLSEGDTIVVHYPIVFRTN